MSSLIDITKASSYSGNLSSKFYKKTRLIDSGGKARNLENPTFGSVLSMPTVGYLMSRSMPVPGSVVVVVRGLVSVWLAGMGWLFAVTIAAVEL